MALNSGFDGVADPSLDPDVESTAPNSNLDPRKLFLYLYVVKSILKKARI